MEITKVADIRSLGAEDVVELSGWDERPFVCRLRRVSLYEMIGSGCVPNPLIPVVRDLFMGMSKALEKNLSDAEDVKAFLTIAKCSMLEPSYQELQEVGIQLTDQQVLEIFFYATRGPRSLAAFRGGKSGGNMDDGEAVRDEAQQHAGNS